MFTMLKYIRATRLGDLFSEDPGVQIIGHFTVVYLVAKPLIWSEAEGDLVVLETRI